MRIIERFDIYMKYKHLNDNKVTEQIKLSNGVIGKSRKEGRDLSDKVIEKILSYYSDLNSNWLLYGEGDMLKHKTNSNPIEKHQAPKGYKKGPYKNTCATENLSVQERLDIFIKSKGLGRYQFEMKVGLPQSYVANVRQAPHPEKVKLISDAFPDLSIEWLITGKGEMIKQDISFYRQLVEVISEEKDRLLSLWQKEQDKVVELEKVNRQLRKDLADTVKMYGESIHSALDRLLSKRA